MSTVTFTVSCALFSIPRTSCFFRKHYTSFCTALQATDQTQKRSTINYHEKGMIEPQCQLSPLKRSREGTKHFAELILHFSLSVSGSVHF